MKKKDKCPSEKDDWFIVCYGLKQKSHENVIKFICSSIKNHYRIKAICTLLGVTVQYIIII
jgi:hypothetical protein